MSFANVHETAESSLEGRFAAARAVTASGLLFLVVLQLPPWVASGHRESLRPLFNADLVLPMLVAVGIGLRAGVALLCVLWIVDWLVITAQQFFFPTALDLLEAHTQLANLSLSALASVRSLVLVLGYSAALLLFVLVCWRVRRHRSTRRAFLAACLFCGAAAIVADSAAGSFGPLATGERKVGLNVAGSPSFHLVVGALRWRDSGSLRTAVDATAPEEVRDMIISRSDRAVVVIVESLGLPLDPALRTYWESILLRSLSDRYALRFASVPFKGGTTSGELRELCALSGSYTQLNSETGRCLPSLMHAAGWRTTALHGFKREMFDRGRWWGYIGFEKSFFDAEHPGLTPRCPGLFAGACDADLVALAFELVQRPREFVYVLTLNSHLPLYNRALSPGEEYFCASFSLKGPLCLMHATYIRVFEAINDGLRSLPQGREVVVVISGDHAPPFPRRVDRDSFAQGVVPHFIIVPKPGVPTRVPAQR